MIFRIANHGLAAMAACRFSAQFCALFQPDASGIDGGVGDGFVADPRSGAVIWAAGDRTTLNPNLRAWGASGAGLPWRRPSRLGAQAASNRIALGWRQ